MEMGFLKSSDGGTTWSPTGPGLNNDAVVYALAINPQHPDVILAGTRGDEDVLTNPYCQGNDSGGIRIYDAGGGVYRSTDGGAHWGKVDEGQACGYVYQLEIDPQNPNNVYVASHQVGVLKSINGGISFAYANQGLGDKSTRSIAIDPNHPNIVYVATWHTEGVAVSTDSGNTWNNLSLGINGDPVIKVKIDPISGNRYALVWGEGLYRMGDGEYRWTATGSMGFNAYDMAISAVNPAVFLFGLQNEGVCVSMNYGNSCAAANQGLYDVDVNTLVRDPFSPAMLVAGTGALGVYKSPDDGITWSAIRNGLPVTDEGNYYSILSILSDPHDPELYYAGTNGSGIYKTANGGSSWYAMNSGLPNLENNLSLQGESQELLPHPEVEDPLFLDGVNNKLATIQSPVTPPLGSRSILAMVIDPTNSALVYAGSGSGLYKTTSGGDSWFSAGLAGLGVFSLDLDTQNPAVLFAGTTNGVYQTSDGGVTWNQVGLAGDLVYSLAIDQTNPDIVFAGTSTQGIFRTYDGGSSWLDDNQGLGDLHVFSLEIDANQPLFQYAGTPSGLYRSTKGGSRWELISLNTYFNYIDPVVSSSTSPDKLYLGTNSGTIAVLFSDKKPATVYLPLLLESPQPWINPYPSP